MNEVIVFVYLGLALLFSLAGILMAVGLIGWLIYEGIQYKRAGKCFFHHFNREHKAMAGAYWYYECPVCGQRDTEKMRRGESPLNQHWLDGGPWHNSLNPETSPPEKLRWKPLFSYERNILIYKDWPYEAPPQQETA